MPKEQSQPEKDLPLYWYSFSFYESKRGKGITFASVSLGLEDKNVTLADINLAKNTLGLPRSAIIISISYLGYITEKAYTE